MTENLFSVPDKNDDSARVQRPAVEPAAPAIRVGNGRAVSRGESNRPSGGLDSRYEYSTGYALHPRSADEMTIIPEHRGSRMKLAVMLAIVAVVLVAALGTALVFAAGH